MKNVFQEFPEDPSKAQVIEGRIIYGPRGSTWSYPGHANPANAMIKGIKLDKEKKLKEYIMLRWEKNKGTVYVTANGAVYLADKEAFEVLQGSLELTVKEFEERYPELYSKLFK